MQQTNRAIELLQNAAGLFDQALANPNIRYSEVAAMARNCRPDGRHDQTRKSAPKTRQPRPRPARTTLRSRRAGCHPRQNSEALQHLQTSLDLNAKRLAANPSARDLLSEARKDPRFDTLRTLPAFQKIVPPD